MGNIQTVLGPIKPEDLGTTLTHEHITWDRGGMLSPTDYHLESVIETILPYLMDLKQAGCKSFVDATTQGSGRNLEILKECARRSGLNILTNVGAWDGSDQSGKYMPEDLRHKTVAELTKKWIYEVEHGLEGTNIKPAYIKLALGDTGELTELQVRLLRAAARTSRKTGLAIQCHTIPSQSAVQAVAIVESEGLPLNRFIWVHADCMQDMDTILLLARKGAWVEFDFIGRAENFGWHIEAIQKMAENGLLNQLLLSQDAGCYYYGEVNEPAKMLRYDRIFKEFMPTAIEAGVSPETFKTLLEENPLNAFLVK